MGETLAQRHSDDGIAIVEMDASNMDIGSKNHYRIWIAVDRAGRRCIK